eukprot:scaffold17699_cov42-Phaeocystis_antarctica.AAC.1
MHLERQQRAQAARRRLEPRRAQPFSRVGPPTHPLARPQSRRVGREHESVAQRVVRGGRGAGCERGLGGGELGEQLLRHFSVVRAQRAAARREQQLPPGGAGLQPGGAGLQPGGAGLQPGDAGLQHGDAGLQHGDA